MRANVRPLCYLVLYGYSLDENGFSLSKMFPFDFAAFDSLSNFYELKKFCAVKLKITKGKKLNGWLLLAAI